MSHNSTAKAVRLDKEARPERYCIVRTCLHRAPCPKHAERESQASQACDEGYMNDVRFGDSPDY